MIRKQRGALARLFAASLALAWPGAAFAQEDLAAQVRRLEERLDAQQRLIDAQAAALAALHRPSPAPLDLAATRARGAEDAQSDAQPQQGPSPPDQTTQPPPSPQVGQPPPERRAEPDLASLPDAVRATLGRGRFVFDPAFEYSRSSSNRLVFRGVEIVSGVQIGVIEASDADRDTMVLSLAGRYGLTDRIEIEARAPYVWRRDRLTTLAQRDQSVTRTNSLENNDLGDVELAARYQLTSGRRGRPVLIGGLRVKTDTGAGPFDIRRDGDGVATELATGSGFWGVEPGLTMLAPSDPAVIFANVGYLFHLARRIDQTIGGVRVGEVDPGDAISAGLGFGLALNPRFSFSLGYRHTMILETETELDATRQQSDPLQVGALLFGLSHRLGQRGGLNANFEFGVTNDAPDARIVLRTPFGF